MSYGNKQYDIPKKVYYSSFDQSFVTGDSPVTLDAKGTLGRNGFDGYIKNRGPGRLTFQITDDGTNYGNAINLESGDSFSLKGISIDSIKITWVSDTKYDVFVL